MVKRKRGRFLGFIFDSIKDAFSRNEIDIFTKVPTIKELIPNNYKMTLTMPPANSIPPIRSLRAWGLLEEHCAILSWRKGGGHYNQGHFNEELYKKILLIRYKAAGTTLNQEDKDK
jgi:hypothetical protein